MLERKILLATMLGAPQHSFFKYKEGFKSIIRRNAKFPSKIWFHCICKQEAWIHLNRMGICTRQMTRMNWYLCQWNSFLFCLRSETEGRGYEIFQKDEKAVLRYQMKLASDGQVQLRPKMLDRIHTVSISKKRSTSNDFQVRDICL